MSEVKIETGKLHLAKSKKIKIECPDGVSWKTKIYLDGKDLFEMLPGVCGIEFEDFVGGVIKLKIHLVGQPTEFIGKAKIIEIFGKENYTLVERGYVEELKKKIKEIKKEKDELKFQIELEKFKKENLKSYKTEVNNNG